MIVQPGLGPRHVRDLKALREKRQSTKACRHRESVIEGFHNGSGQLLSCLGYPALENNSSETQILSPDSQGGPHGGCETRRESKFSRIKTPGLPWWWSSS